MDRFITGKFESHRHGNFTFRPIYAIEEKLRRHFETSHRKGEELAATPSRADSIVDDVLYF